MGFTLPVPLVLIFGALAWVQFDKSSAVRKAVNSYAKQMIAGAEIKALQEEARARAIIAAFQKDRADKAEKRLSSQIDAKTVLAITLSKIRETNQELQNEIDELAALPEPVSCRVDSALIERLRRR